MDKTMKCNINNVGRFKSAELILNGLTVVAGTNSSGKTTLGKSIYAAVKCEIALLDNVIQQKLDIAENLLSRLRQFELIQRQLESDSKSFVIKKSSLDQIRKLYTAVRHIRPGEGSELQSIVEELLKLLEHEQIYDFLLHYGGAGTDASLPDMIEVLKSAINFDDSPINRKLVEYAFSAEFENQIASIAHSNGNSSVSFENSRYDFGQGSCTSCRIGKPSFQNIVYLDDVYAFDNMQRAYYPHGDKQEPFRLRASVIRNRLYSFDTHHRQDLVTLLFNITQPTKRSVAQDLSLDKINAEANTIFKNILNDGRMHFSKDERRYVYREHDEEITLCNVASGIKSIALLDLLVRSGFIHETTCVIIDEPETHLHPEWQVKMAELLVTLVQKTNVKILINTHSPYFVEAIRVYSEAKQIENLTRFYHVTISDTFSSSLIEVTDDISPIYEALAQPYRILDEVYNREL
jgi:predicted ATP-dependent endonuclease of OLD family